MALPEAIDRPSILIVVDSQPERSTLSSVLSSLYRVVLAGTAEEAWTRLGTEVLPDLILIDGDLGGDDTLDFFKLLKRRTGTRDVPIIVLRGQRNAAGPSTIELDLNEYLSKPIDPAVLLMRVAHQLRLNSATAFTRNRRPSFKQEVEQQTREIDSLKEIAVHALVSVMGIRDLETENHGRRTQGYVMSLANHLAQSSKFSDQLNRAARELLFRSVPLHDIGKIGIPDAILLKAGKLSLAEREIMKTHTTLGRDAIQRAESKLGICVPLLSVVKELTYSHHERWDGHGYPEGKVGDAIPLCARIMAVADVYDALIARRVYKAPMSHGEVVAYIAGKRSIDFDPDITDAFVELQSQFLAISSAFSQEFRPGSLLEV